MFKQILAVALAFALGTSAYACGYGQQVVGACGTYQAATSYQAVGACGTYQAAAVYQAPAVAVAHPVYNAVQVVRLKQVLVPTVNYQTIVQVQRVTQVVAPVKTVVRVKTFGY